MTTSKTETTLDYDCPIHKSWVLELDGSKHCNVTGCSWRTAPQTAPPMTTILDDLMAIQRLIDAACFTNSEVMTGIREKAEDALESIMARLNVRIN